MAWNDEMNDNVMHFIKILQIHTICCTELYNLLIWKIFREISEQTKIKRLKTNNNPKQ